MSPRSYRLGERAAPVAETRARIVAATRELLTAGGVRRLAIEEVARRADVARATVYYQFKSKRGLLEAVVADVQERAGQHAIASAVELPDPLEALRATFARGCRFWAAEETIVRRVTALAAIDPEMRDVLDRAEDNRLGLVTRLAGRLADEGQLRPGCSRHRAIDVLWLLSSFEAFDQLRGRRSLPTEEVAAVLVDLAGRLLGGPGG